MNAKKSDLCRCGCGQVGVYWVEGLDINGAKYAEPACSHARDYLAEASAAFKYPFKSRRIYPIGRAPLASERKR